jgi:hypothetical protein
VRSNCHAKPFNLISGVSRDGRNSCAANFWKLHPLVASHGLLAPSSRFRAPRRIGKREQKETVQQQQTKGTRPYRVAPLVSLESHEAILVGKFSQHSELWPQQPSVSCPECLYLLALSPRRILVVEAVIHIHMCWKRAVCNSRLKNALEFCSSTPISSKSYTFTSHSEGIRVSGAQEGTPVRSELLLFQKALPPHNTPHRPYCSSHSHFNVHPKQHCTCLDNVIVL